MAVTTNQVMADTVPTVLENARFTEQFIAEMSALVWNIKKKLHDGKTINVPYFGTVTARALTEGVDNITSETMSDTLVTITPGEVGCKLILIDKLVRDNNEDIKAAAGRILGNAMEVKRDQDLLGQLDDATNSLGSGSTLTLGQVAAARAILKGNPVSSGGPAPGKLAFVHHPYTLLDLVDVFTPLVPAAGTTQSASGGIADEVVKNYGIGKLFGIPVIEDGNIDTTTVANTAKGGIFSTGEGGSIILATSAEWSVEPERDASLRATELNIVGEYGIGEYLGGWIVEMNHDATLPA
jgi:hypothetical protein